MAADYCCSAIFMLLYRLTLHSRVVGPPLELLSIAISPVTAYMINLLEPTVFIRVESQQ